MLLRCGMPIVGGRHAQYHAYSLTLSPPPIIARRKCLAYRMENRVLPRGACGFVGDVLIKQVVVQGMSVSLGTVIDALQLSLTLQWDPSGSHVARPSLLPRNNPDLVILFEFMLSPRQQQRRGERTRRHGNLLFVPSPRSAPFARRHLGPPPYTS